MKAILLNDASVLLNILATDKLREIANSIDRQIAICSAAKEEAKKLREENGYHYKIQIDGSCNPKTFKRLKEAGADIYILGGSGLFSLDSDIHKAVEIMKHNFDEAIG